MAKEFDWKDFWSNKGVQAAGSGIVSAAVAKALGLDWVPSLAIGAGVGGTVYGGRTLYDAYKKNQEDKAVNAALSKQFLNDASRNIEGRVVQPKPFPVFGNSQDTPHRIFPGSEYTVQDLYSRDPEISESAWAQANEQNDYHNYMKSLSQTLDANAIPRDDQWVIDNANYDNVATQPTSDQQDQSDEEYYANTDPTGQLELDYIRDQEIAEAEYLKQQRAEAAAAERASRRAKFTLMENVRRMKEQMNPQIAPDGKDPYYVQPGDAMKLAYGPAVNAVKRAYTNTANATKNYFDKLFTWAPSNENSATENELLGRLASISALMRNGDTDKAVAALNALTPHVESATPKIKQAYINLINSLQ